MINVVKGITLWVFSMALTCAQEIPLEVVRSKDRVLIEGKAYYIHIVKPGQTLYSISRAYQVDQKQIADENPVIILGLRPDMSLKIPVAEDINQNAAMPANDGNYIFHRAEEKQTVYSISRQYQVSVQEILDANPGLDISQVSIGQYIRIPRKKIIEERSSFSQPKEAFLFHWVNPRETLFSLSKKYNVSVEQIREANDGLAEGLKSNSVIRIPVQQMEEVLAPVVESRDIPDEILEGRSGGMDEEPAGLCDTIDYYRRPQTINVALLLPFYLDENSARTVVDSSEVNTRGERVYKVSQRPADWIFPRSYNFLEFYEGALLALDSLSKRGLSVNLHVYDTGRDSTKVLQVIRMRQLDQMDLIIGPVFTANQGNLSVVADYARKKKITMVSPLSANADILKFNPGLFQVQPSIYTEIQKAAEFLAGHYQKNIVLVHDGDLSRMEYINYLKKNLSYQFSYYTYSSDVMIKEVIYSQSRPQRDSINILEQPLVKDRDNLIIVFSHEEPFVSKVLGNLNTLTGRYPMQVVGFSNWQRFENIELEYFYSLRIQLVANQFVDYSDPRVLNFLSAFRKKYLTEPSQFSLAWDGYDTFFFFLSAMQKYGRDFERCVRGHRENLLHMEMQYKRRYFYDGFENERYFIISFEPGWKVVKRRSIL